MAASAQDRVFESAAELFGLLSAPRRLQIVCVLCEGEKNVSELMAHMAASQSNVSQHLGILYRGGVGDCGPIGGGDCGGGAIRDCGGGGGDCGGGGGGGDCGGGGGC